MRFLKTKISLAVAAVKAKELKQNQPLSKVHLQESVESKNIVGKKKRERIPGFSFTSEASRATKNIVKNYGKAICTFAVSNAALPYLAQILEEQNLTLKDFTEYMNQMKDLIAGLHHFRSVLLIAENNSSELVAKKKAFIALGEAFIKYFSVNWIYNSRVFHKEAHLKFRFKMLRRIQNPELFTYLKTSSKKSVTKSLEF